MVVSVVMMNSIKVNVILRIRESISSRESDDTKSIGPFADIEEIIIRCC